MLALDHRASLKRLWVAVIGTPPDDQQLVTFKSRIISSLRDQYSGLLLDPEYGLPAYQQFVGNESSKPYLLAVEESGYRDLPEGRITELEYSPTQVKEMGAGGVKLLLYFDPQAPLASCQLASARDVLEDVRSLKLPFFLEIVTYSSDQSITTTKPSEPVIASLETFLAAGIRPDVFKLEYPGDQNACQQVTELLGETPWILLTRGVDYSEFKENLKIACQAGCRGFLAGRSIWQGAVGLTGKELTDHLEKVIRPRFAEISQIALATA